MGCSAKQCILAVVEFPLSEYNKKAGCIPPSTSHVWMGESVCFFFLTSLLADLSVDSLKLVIHISKFSWFSRDWDPCVPLSVQQKLVVRPASVER